MSVDRSSIADERAGFGASPISSDRPAGEDARATPEFEAVEAEMRKLETDGPNAVDWRVVVEGGLAIIVGRSKDLLLGAWCAYGLFRREGIAGLAVGLAVLRGMIQWHWEGAFPPARRERARVATLDWLVGRLAPGVASLEPQEADALRVIAVQEALDDIDAAVSGKLQKESLSLGELLRALRPHVDQAKRIVAEAEERAAAAARAEEQFATRQTAEVGSPASREPAMSRAAPLPAAQAVLAPVPSPPQATSLPELNSAIDGLSPVLLAYAQNLRQQEPGDPRAYVLARVASWLRFDQLPAQQGGRTLVVPPLATIEAIETMRAQGQARAALAAAEELTWSAPFWLDAHRHSFELLGELGRDFEAARASVAGMLRFFAQRYPQSLTLVFNDGRPFADEATRELAAQAPSGANGHAAHDEMIAAIAQARALLGGGKPYEALDALSQTLRRASSGRQRILWQVAQARFCVDEGFIAAALPLVDHLDRTVVERDLESWEPELAASVTELRLRTLLHSDAQSLLAEDRRRAALEEARGRMARLDIGAATRLLRP